MGWLALLSLALICGRYWLGGRQRLPAGLEQLARFFYFVGLPYFAMIGGLLAARSLGLRGLEHFSLIGLGGEAGPGVTVQRAITLMLVDWLIDSRATIFAGLAALAVLGGVLLHLARSGVSLAAPLSSVSLLDTIYQAVHWAFYRAIFWQLTGDLYLGVVMGAGFVLLEWALIARARRDTAFLNGLPLQAMILFLTSAIFYYSPNLWLLMPVHLAMVGLGVRGWGPGVRDQGPGAGG